MESQPLWVNAVVFAGAAAAIWWAGTRLEHYTDVVAGRTDLGHAFAGLVLLARLGPPDGGKRPARTWSRRTRSEDEVANHS